MALVVSFTGDGSLGGLSYWPAGTPRSMDWYDPTLSVLAWQSHSEADIVLSLGL